MRVCVIGGGVSGLACAGRLSALGADVVVFDKGRQVGGRMSSRRVELSGGGSRFDHGAPVFEVRDGAFREAVEAWVSAGVCAWWAPEWGVWDGVRLEAKDLGDPVAVGTPAMSAVCDQLARGLDVRVSSTVVGLPRAPSGWIART